MRAIISAPGSRGDVNPMIAIGRELTRRGWEVVISIAEPYAAIAAEAGLRPEVVIDTERFHSLLSNKAVWKPIRGVRAIMRDISADFLTLHNEVIRSHHRAGETVLVSHPLDFASRVFRDCDPTTPLIDVHLAPVMLRTYDAPPRLSPFWFELSRPSWAVRTTYFLADHLGVDPLIAPPINRLRSAHGLPPVRRVLDRWGHSPDRILAMYPDWFAPATKQFQPRLVHTGFPLDDADDRDLEDAPDDRPILFTPGTAQHHGQQFFQRCVAACDRLQRPGMLVSPHPENFPTSMSHRVRTSDYAPFGKLLPRCAAIVHHGGIGTTSQALAAGIPQIIRPLAFDQFDNATRVQTLGCGVWLRRDRDLAETLDRILSDETMRSRTAEIAGRVSRHTAAANAAQAIQSTWDQHDQPPEA